MTKFSPESAQIIVSISDSSVHLQETSFYLGTDNKHAFLKNYPAGKWTDSTQLSLTMAKSLTRVPYVNMSTIVDEHISAFKFRTDGWGFTNKQTIERLVNGFLLVFRNV